MNSASESMADHEVFMRRCLELARIALSQHNTPVGSVVVLDGKIIDEGIESVPMGNSLTGHAELLACQNAVDSAGSQRLDGATIYTTAEPCFMCSYVIRQCGISLVVYGLETPTIGGVTSSHPLLTDAGLSTWSPPPSIVSGVMHNECQRLKTES